MGSTTGGGLDPGGADGQAPEIPTALRSLMEALARRIAEFRSDEREQLLRDVARLEAERVEAERRETAERIIGHAIPPYASAQWILDAWLKAGGPVKIGGRQ